MVGLLTLGESKLPGMFDWKVETRGVDSGAGGDSGLEVCDGDRLLSSRERDMHHDRRDRISLDQPALQRTSVSVGDLRVHRLEERTLKLKRRPLAINPKASNKCNCIRRAIFHLNLVCRD